MPVLWSLEAGGRVADHRLAGNTDKLIHSLDLNYYGAYISEKI